MSPTPFTHHLTKRDELPKPVIILLIMVGAIALVLLGFAIHSAFGFGGKDANTAKPMSVEQMEYMAEVKGRNLEALAREGRVAYRVDGRARGSETVYEEGEGSLRH